MKVQNTTWNYLSIIIPSSVTILGFIINYYQTKRNMRNEIIKKKTNIHLEKLSDIPEKALVFLDDILSKKIYINPDDFYPLVRKVFSYGSIESITILSSMQQHNYTDYKNKSEDTYEVYKLMAYIVLLVCQIKFDITDIIVSPELWYRIKLNDYEENLENKKLIVKANNDIVSKLKLNKEFKIKM